MPNSPEGQSVSVVAHITFHCQGSFCVNIRTEGPTAPWGVGAERVLWALLRNTAAQAHQVQSFPRDRAGDPAQMRWNRWPNSHLMMVTRVFKKNHHVYRWQGLTSGSSGSPLHRVGLLLGTRQFCFLLPIKKTTWANPVKRNWRCSYLNK